MAGKAKRALLMSVLLGGKEPRNADYPAGRLYTRECRETASKLKKIGNGCPSGRVDLANCKPSSLAAQVREEPEKERKSDAQKKAGDDGKVKRSVFAAMNDVPGKFSQAEGEFVAEVQKRTDQDKKCSKGKQRAAEIAKRLHQAILPEAGNKSLGQTIAIRP